MVSLSSKLTILIPTYKRQKELQKKILYLNNYKFKVIIVDGSPKPLKKNFINKNKKIKYIHFPVENRYERIFFSKKFIKTKYVKLEADNDYYLPSALLKSVKYLENNFTYSAVIGKCGLYSKYKDEIYIKQLFKTHKSLTHENFYNRAQSYIRNFSPALYHSVLRTSVFNKQIKSLKICKKIYGNKFDMMAEFCSILICCSQGKVKNLNQITWLRSDDDTTKRKNFIGIKKLIGKASNYQFTYDHKMLDLFRSGYLENFFSVLSGEISTKSNYNFSKKKIKDIFLLSLINSINRKKNLKKFKNIKKMLVFLIPSKIKKYIRFLLRINGPSLKDVMMAKVKVNYLFNKKELQILNKHFLND